MPDFSDDDAAPLNAPQKMTATVKLIIYDIDTYQARESSSGNSRMVASPRKRRLEARGIPEMSKPGVRTLVRPCLADQRLTMLDEIFRRRRATERDRSDGEPCPALNPATLPKRRRRARIPP